MEDEDQMRQRRQKPLRHSRVLRYDRLVGMAKTEIPEQMENAPRSPILSMKRAHHLFLLSLLASALCAQSSSDPRSRRNKGTNLKPATVAVFASGDFYGMPYRLIEPLEIKDGVRYPLILNLHGRAGIGDDNLSSLRPWSATFADPEWRAAFPCFVVTPQSWSSWSAFNERPPEMTPETIAQFPKIWQRLIQARLSDVSELSTGSLTMTFLLLDQMAREFPIDTDRVYVLGHSMGGFGSWNAIWTDPERFAAAIPSAGGLTPWKDPAKFKNVPVWAFHGTDDPTVPYAFSQRIFDRLAEVGGNIKLTAMDGVKHGSSAHAFAYEGDDPEKGWTTSSASEKCDPTPRIWDWLFRQRRR